MAGIKVIQEEEASGELKQLYTKAGGAKPGEEL